MSWFTFPFDSPLGPDCSGLGCFQMCNFDCFLTISCCLIVSTCWFVRFNSDCFLRFLSVNLTCRRTHRHTQTHQRDTANSTDKVNRKFLNTMVTMIMGDKDWTIHVVNMTGHRLWMVWACSRLCDKYSRAIESHYDEIKTNWKVGT